ncbi:MAG: uridine kinase [Candidatus Eisenbacteria bacterium]|nr:uridine kinase [Candidatus Eisenbacteria bacterium]
MNVSSGGRILIGIAGGTGSGKSLVAQRIIEALGDSRATIIKQDHYYRDLSWMSWEERVRTNFDHPDAFDATLLRDHLRALLQGQTVPQPQYDFTRHVRLPDSVPIGGHPILLVEGILILADPEIREMMDIKVFVDTDSDIRLLRRIRRDVAERGRTLESVLEQYERDVRPMHLQFVEPSKRYADIIIPEGGYNRVAIDLLRTKIVSVLAEKWPLDEKETP